MADYNTVNKTIHYNIIDLMEFGLDSYLEVDALLLEMAKPVTQLDMITVPASKKKKLFVAIESFRNRSRKRLESFTEDGVKQLLIHNWLPTLPMSMKQSMVSEFNMVQGFDADGYAIFDPHFYNTWLSIKNKEAKPHLVNIIRRLPTEPFQ